MTPEQIKAALRVCTGDGYGCGHCPYRGEKECVNALMRDALAIINALETENEKTEGDAL